MSKNSLFTGIQIEELFRSTEGSITRDVNQLGREIIGKIDEFIEVYRKKYTYLTLTLDETPAKSFDENVDINVSHRMDYSVPFVKGTRINYKNKFTGAGHLFSARPIAYSSNPPKGDVDDGKHEITWSYNRIDETPETIKSAYEANLSKIKSFMSSINSSIDTFNAGLNDLIRGKLIDRENTLKNLDADLDKM